MSILSAIGTPTYKMAKFLVLITSRLTINEFTVKDFFRLQKKLMNNTVAFIWLA